MFHFLCNFFHSTYRPTASCELFWKKCNFCLFQSVKTEQCITFATDKWYRIYSLCMFWHCFLCYFQDMSSSLCCWRWCQFHSLVTDCVSCIEVVATMWNHLVTVILLSMVSIGRLSAAPCARFYIHGLHGSHYPQADGVYVLQSVSSSKVIFFFSY